MAAKKRLILARHHSICLRWLNFWLSLQQDSKTLASLEPCRLYFSFSTDHLYLSCCVEPNGGLESFEWLVSIAIHKGDLHLEVPAEVS